MNAQNELLATGRFFTVLPSFILRMPGRLPLKALPVPLPNPKMPVGLITLKNRTLTPLAQQFIDNVHTLIPANAGIQIPRGIWFPLSRGRLGRGRGG